MFDNKIQEDSLDRIFSQPWWLDAVAPKSWRELKYKFGENNIMRFPFVEKSIFGFKIISMPPFTQTLGPVMNFNDTNYSKKLSVDMKLFDNIINDLPNFHFFRQRFHYSIKNWLPFYWAGFHANTRYTYIIADLTDLDKVYNQFSYSKKKNIKKAQNVVEVLQDLPSNQFYNHHKNSLLMQGEKISYSFSLFSRIYNNCYTNDAGKIFYCIDKNKIIHSTIFIIWDSNSAYFLISSVDQKLRNSGSLSLLIWEAIKFCSTKTKQFDFEGSMIKNVERSFRNFGTIQVPYYEISKLNIPILNKIRI